MSETIPQPDPNHVIIHDTTLRDGAQMPRIDFDLEDRLVIAQRLSDMGVDIIEAGFPFAVEGDFEAASAIAETVEGSKISALSRTRHEDIEKAWMAIEPAKHKGGTRIHTFIGTSPTHMRDKLKMTPEQVIQEARSGVTKALEFTDDVQFSPEDASRSDFDFMMRVILEAVDAGATTINVPDTVGFAVMGEYAARLKAVKEQIDRHFGSGLVVVSAHCHDDLGWSTANSLMAVAGGARQVEATIGGIGERASNAAEEEVIANIAERPEMFGDTYTRIDTTQLTSVYREVMKRAGLPIQLNKAIVGRNAFAHEAGIHQHGVSQNVATYEHMPAGKYGQTAAEMVIAKLSGWRGVESRLKAIEIAVEPDVLKAISKLAKEASDQAGRQMADNDIEKLAAAETGDELFERYSVEDLDAQESGNVGSAKIVLVDNLTGERLQADARSPKEGAIDAIRMAVNLATGFEGDMADWEAKARESGSSAVGGIYVTVKLNGHSVQTYAEATSVNQASAAAYVEAVNMIERIKGRRQAGAPVQLPDQPFATRS